VRAWQKIWEVWDQLYLHFISKTAPDDRLRKRFSPGHA
jgi:hypothetical protein